MEITMPVVRTLSRITSETIVSGGARLLSNRRLMRAPIWLYRARLGFLFGSRMLLLEHVGRQSGARRYVVLEVFDRPAPGAYVVVSGFGSRAQWFRNVMANPKVRVSVAGRRPVPATARVLPSQEADLALNTYVRRHPRAWGTFKPVIETTLGTQIGDRGADLPMVALDLER
jgi:deazaflavin-dependent oxidoreductase (nitroreductase family)